MYEEKATQLVTAAGEIIAIVKRGMNMGTAMALLGKMMSLGPVLTFIQELPASERDEFFAEVFDQSMGSEEHALLKELAFLDSEALETVTDGMKAGVIAYFNREVA